MKEHYKRQIKERLNPARLLLDLFMVANILLVGSMLFGCIALFVFILMEAK